MYIYRVLHTHIQRRAINLNAKLIDLRKSRIILMVLCTLRKSCDNDKVLEFVIHKCEISNLKIRYENGGRRGFKKCVVHFVKHSIMHGCSLTKVHTSRHTGSSHGQVHGQ